MADRFTGNILVITYWSIHEPLVTNYTYNLLRQLRLAIGNGSKIFLFTLDKQSPSTEVKKQFEQLNIDLVGVAYKRLRLNTLFFGLRVVAHLRSLIRTNDITVIHAFCAPGGAIGTMMSVLSRTALIVDSYEPHADTMVESGIWKKSGFVYRVLLFFEKWQSKRATYLLSLTEGMKSYAQRKYNYTIPPEKFLVKPSVIDVEKFEVVERKNEKLVKTYNLENKLVGLYAGKFGSMYLDDEIFNFVKTCVDYWGEKFVMLFMNNLDKEAFRKRHVAFGIPEHQVRHLFVADEAVPDHFALADFAMTPVRPIPSKRYCSPIKNGEYWAIGLPVVISRDISDDSDLIESHNIGVVLKDQNSREYNRAVVKIEELLKDSHLQTRAKDLARSHRSNKRALKIYSDIYAQLA